MGRMEDSPACRNCGVELAGEYCHGCGEPRPDEHEWTWSHFVHHATHEFLHVDSKIFQTFWLLLRRPGLLTEEYWAGRRTAYLRPLRIYILCAAVHLLAVTSGLYTVEFIKVSGDTAQMNRVIEALAQRTHASGAEAEMRLNATMGRIYAVTQYGAVLGFSLLPWWMFRKRREHYIQHLIFGLHMYSFWFLLSSLAGTVIPQEWWKRSPMPLVTAAYFFFAVRRLYGGGVWRNIGRAAALRVGLMLVEMVALGGAVGLAITWMLARR